MNLTVTKALHSLFELDQFEILSKSHKKNRVDKRQAFVLIMRNLEFTFVEIAQAINKHHSTIIKLEARTRNQKVIHHVNRFLNAIHQEKEVTYEPIHF